MKKIRWLDDYNHKVISSFTYIVKWFKLLAFVFMFHVSCFMFHARSAYAAIDWLGTGCAVEEELPSGEVITVVTLKGLECIFSQLLNVAARLAGLAVFVMLIIGGWQYITSGGDKQASQKARNTLTFAILGLVLLIGSWFILRFIKYFTGVNVTEFVVTPD